MKLETRHSCRVRMTTVHRELRMYRTLLPVLVAIAVCGGELDRHALAAVPPSRYTVADGTVTDNVTGLIWQQPIDGTGDFTQTQAAEYCSGLTLGGFTSGWRLPTRAELLSIVDASVPQFSIDATAFPDLPNRAAFFRTSSPYAPTSGAYWIVSFGDRWEGGSTYGGDLGGVALVRCVH